MSSEEVLYEKEQFTATITLNRPEKMNTISASMLNDLSQALVEANRDPAVRVVVLTGKGRAFCAGLDLSAQAQGETKPSSTARRSSPILI